MANEYIAIKFLHILIAILSLGTSAGLGIVLEFYGNHPVHGRFVLRAIERIELFFVVPGYVFMLVTGLWMVHLSWPWTTQWIQTALGLWGIGLVLLGISLVVLHKQVKSFDTNGPASASYRRVSFVERVMGAGTGLLVIVILYLMVFKPGS